MHLVNLILYRYIDYILKSPEIQTNYQGCGQRLIGKVEIQESVVKDVG